MVNPVLALELPPVTDAQAELRAASTSLRLSLASWDLTAGSAGSAGAVGQKTHTGSKRLLTTLQRLLTALGGDASSASGLLGRGLSLTEARVLLSACGRLSCLGGQGLPQGAELCEGCDVFLS